MEISVRLVITGGGLVVTIVIYVLAHCSIISSNIRDNEVYASLNQAMDYGVDVMEDIYADLDYQSEKEEIYEEALMSAFCNAVSLSVKTDGEISVFLLDADIEEGRFYIAVKEEYTYPFKGRKGVCCCEKAVAFR